MIDSVELERILDKCMASGDLTRSEILFLLNLRDDRQVARLLAVGDAVREARCGPEVHIRALVEFSNFCARSCSYCGLRAPNAGVKRYRMSRDEIVELVVKLDASGFKTTVLQSGEDPGYTAEMIADVVSRIKSATDMAVTLSVGERPYEDYRLWKEAGADRYLLRHETANRELYASLHPDSDFDNRMRCLHWLRELGYQVGAGCMVGTPGQAIHHLADDIEFLRDLQPDMAGIGPYIPHPNTPLADCSAGSLQMTLKMVALARIVTRDTLLPATTATGGIDPEGYERSLQAGADVVMINCTPADYRVHYEIYPNKCRSVEEPVEARARLLSRIQAIGRSASLGHGHSRKTIAVPPGQTAPTKDWPALPR